MSLYCIYFSFVCFFLYENSLKTRNKNKIKKKTEKETQQQQKIYEKLPGL